MECGRGTATTPNRLHMYNVGYSWYTTVHAVVYPGKKVLLQGPSGPPGALLRAPPLLLRPRGRLLQRSRELRVWPASTAVSSAEGKPRFEWSLSVALHWLTGSWESECKQCYRVLVRW